MVLGRRVFAATRETPYQLSLTVLIASFGTVLMISS